MMKPIKELTVRSKNKSKIWSSLILYFHVLAIAKSISETVLQLQLWRHL